MGEDRISVLLVHPFSEVTDYISALLRLETDMTLAGTVTSARDAIKEAAKLRPNIIMVSSELSDMESPALVRQILQRLPYAGVIAIVTSDDQEEIRKHMLAGARSFLVFPFGSELLVQTIRDVYRRTKPPNGGPPPQQTTTEEGKVVAVFGPKGGVGKTMLAANLAVAMRNASKQRVALVDASFFFGDLHLFLNIQAEHTVIDFVERGADVDVETLERIMQKHSSGVHVMVRPPRPEHAEMINSDNLRRLLELTVKAYDWTIIDCSASYDDRMLTLLDRADVIVLVTTPEVGSLFNAGAFLTLAHALGYPSSRIHIVLNRHDSQVGISASDAESALAHPIEFRIPSRGREMATTLNQGTPIVSAQPNSDVSRAIISMADYMLKKLEVAKK